MHLRPIVFPILGDASWVDTYLAARDGGRRSHAGQDIFGKKMQPLVAAVDGVVVSLRHRASGNSLTIQDADGWYYRYLHINNDTPGTDDGANRFEHAFAPGLREGSLVQRGQLVAFLGDSGNAEGTPPHLHFEIRMPNADLWRAPAVNAAPSLRLAQDPTRFTLVGPEAYSPWTTADEFAIQQARDILGRSLSTREVLIWTNRLQRAELTPDELVQYYLSRPASFDAVGSAARLWVTMYERAPSEDLLRWGQWRRAGQSLLDQARHHLTDDGLRDRFGGDMTSFVTTAYQRALHREPTDAERQAALEALDAGTTRAELLVLLSQSDEAKVALHHETVVIVAFESMLRRGPTVATYRRWAAYVERPGGYERLVYTIRTSDEYAHRFEQDHIHPG